MISHEGIENKDALCGASQNVGLRNVLFAFVLNFFRSVNRKIRSRLPSWKLEQETLEHVNSVVRVFKFLVFPATLFYVFARLYFFREIALDSTLWGLAVFLYSNFLSDLPSICRRRKSSGKDEDLPWYKKYTILLFAPLFIWFLFSGIQLRWDTAENFHNFKSLTIYGAFLFLLSFLTFGNLTALIGDITKILLPTLYGVIGYLTHLKVDKIW